MLRSGPCPASGGHVCECRSRGPRPPSAPTCPSDDENRPRILTPAQLTGPVWPPQRAGPPERARGTACTRGPLPPERVTWGPACPPFRPSSETRILITSLSWGHTQGRGRPSVGQICSCAHWKPPRPLELDSQRPPPPAPSTCTAGALQSREAAGAGPQVREAGTGPRHPGRRTPRRCVVLFPVRLRQ